MFKLNVGVTPEQLGFAKHDIDYVYRGKNSLGGVATLFTIYKGSPYIRCARTGYVLEEQLKLVYQWTKSDYIMWEE